MFPQVQAGPISAHMRASISYKEQIDHWGGHKQFGMIPEV